jgi:hypothetical protein
MRVRSLSRSASWIPDFGHAGSVGPSRSGLRETLAV